MSIRISENKPESVKLLEEWYYTAIQYLNEAFVEYLQRSYVEGYVEQSPVKVVNYPAQSGLCDNCQFCNKDFCEQHKKLVGLVFICKSFARDYD